MQEKIKIAVDAMGGDGSPKKVIEGIKLHLKKSKNCFYQIFGDKNLIIPLLNNNFVENNYELIHTTEKVIGNDTPLGAAKRGRNTSMWLAIENVKYGKSDIIISAGNTGALLVLAKLNLKMIENIDKPALSALWPNKKGMSVVLDLGANIECSEKNLIDFSIMGSSLYKSLFKNDLPNVALLNIGSEETKGNETIKNTYRNLLELKNNNFNFNGYIEGNNLMDGNVNVIVTDGFTGNVALKTAEGTANFITSELKKNMTSNLIGKIATLLNYTNLNKFKKKLDPRLYNGAILLGLDSAVVKSHGSTDSIGFFHSLEVCEKIVNGKLIDKIKQSII